MKKIILLEVGDVLYNPKYNGFHEIRRIKKNTVVLSGCCNYISDTKTVINNNKVKIDYLCNLKPIYKNHKFMEYCYAANGWRSTRKKKEEAYLFYKDKSIIKSWNN